MRNDKENENQFKFKGQNNQWLVEKAVNNGIPVSLGINLNDITIASKQKKVFNTQKYS